MSGFGHVSSTRMVIESEKLWKETELEIGYNVYFKTQQLELGPKERNSLVAVIDNCEKQLIQYRILDHEQANECFSVEIPDDWIAVVSELGGVLKPTKAVAMFQTLAIKHGAVLKDKMEIVDVERDEDRGCYLSFEK
ncbi:putative FAD/NAD(P)-binding domain superfamily [Helianthus annuus]|nr:putative FAD/NAD(P)-binding domain superfamily [Helianthus annuus]